MLLKALLVALLLFVVFNLFHALYYMIKNDEQAPKMSKYLGRRLMFSALIILCIIIAIAAGFITPNPRPF
jgi:branched-subunit amino acid transport protein AzlD